MTIDIDALENMAKAVIDAAAGDFDWHKGIAAWSGYREAARPENILALIAEVRALREENADWKRRWQDAVEQASSLTIERNHWKANHDNQVARARFLVERSDIPLERVRAYERMAALQAFHDFFRDRCEGLFAQFGMEAVDAYNKAVRGAK